MPKLTKRFVESVEPDPERDIVTWDGQLGGFGLRVKPSGRKTYVLQFRNAHGRSRRLTLGVHGVLMPAAAGKEAKQLLAEVARGEDPAETRQRARHGVTVRELVQLGRSPWWRRMLDLAHLGPALRRLRLYRDLRQHELARAAGVTKAMVSAYERGRRRPSLPTLVRLLNAIDADFATLQRAVRQARRCGH